MTDANTELFTSIGLDPKLIATFAKKQKNAQSLLTCINEANISGGCPPSTGKLIYEVATKMKSNLHLRPRVLEYIVNGSLSTPNQVTAALKYCKKNSDIDRETFEHECGVGITFSEADIIEVVENVIARNANRIASDGKKAIGKCYEHLRKELKWADGKLVNEIFKPRFDAAVANAVVSPPENSEEKNPPTGTTSATTAVEDDEEEVVTVDKYLTGRDLPDAHNSEEALAARERSVGNLFITRFPPEPNGKMHIGHCKAMTFNFTLAEKKGGRTLLRFDDTNPATEKKEHMDDIIENVRFMGFEVNDDNITYSSDYFQELYELALKLIRDGNAYVCHQTKDEMESSRRSYRTENKIPSPWRDRSVEENLREFEKMKCGYYAEGEAMLRMKGDLNSPNPNMWDHVAYRIKHEPHPGPNAGDKWCIYPTYDYTHCIVDSLEWITASCCTLEFENRRESYFWLLDVLDLYKPVVWEYSRLNVIGNVLSKRKLLKLVNGGLVHGWDDPRLLTINGLRRRGYTAEILKDFVMRAGVTRKDNHLSPLLLEACAREFLNENASRAMAVVKPIKVIIQNYPEGKTEEIECPNFPQDPSRGSHVVTLSREVFIDSDDFRVKANKKYFGLAPGKTVRLKYAYNITYVRHSTDSEGNVNEIIVEYDPSSNHDTKGVKKGFLTWVGAETGARTEFRIYENLFLANDADRERIAALNKTVDPFDIELGDDYLEKLNPDSEIIFDGYIDAYVYDKMKTEEGKRFQFERVGYFAVDKDSTERNPVFNRIVTLREAKR